MGVKNILVASIVTATFRPHFPPKKFHPLKIEPPSPILAGIFLSDETLFRN
jgi:hypothetical protein